MSFYSEASLAYVASAGAGKDGKTYSMKPVDGTGDFTFSRGSNLAATRVGPTGLIEKGRENLLLQSNQFDTTWTNYLSTETSGQIGYDGSSDAWLLTKSGASGQIRQNVTSSGVATFSVYAKANASDYIQIVCGSVYQYFNLSLGTLGAGSGIAAAIEAIGTNGWYRCSVSFNSSITSVRIYPAENNTASGINGSIYIQDAQLEIGLAATDYIESGATTGKAGLLEDEPRFDYSGGATCPSLLLEPSRTQLVSQSEYYGAYALQRVTLTSNYGTSPEGVQNAAAIFNTTANGRHNLSGAYFSVTSGTSYVNSVFAKAGTITKIKLRLYSGGGIDIGFNDGDFDLTNGTATGTGAGIESYGNGWYRCYVGDSPTSSVSNAIFNLELLDANGGISYVGSVTDYVEIFGSQVEQGSYPTSYIPNHSGGTITRGVDDLTSAALSINGLFGATSGSIFMEFTNPLQGLTNNWFTMDGFAAGSAAFMRIRGYWQMNIPQLTWNPSANLGSLNNATKVAVKWGGGVAKLFIDGAEDDAATYTGGDINMNGALTALSGFYDFAQNNANFKQMLFFQDALSDADCISLTTL